MLSIHYDEVLDGSDAYRTVNEETASPKKTYNMSVLWTVETFHAKCSNLHAYIFSHYVAVSQCCFPLILWCHVTYGTQGGALNFFQVGVCGPDFRSVGNANWYLPLNEGACELKISKFLGFVNWKFLNFGACELKKSKFGSLKAKIWAKVEAIEAKISKFSQKGVLMWTESFAWNGTLTNYRRGMKRRSSGPHIPIPSF